MGLDRVQGQEARAGSGPPTVAVRNRVMTAFLTRSQIDFLIDVTLELIHVSAVHPHERGRGPMGRRSSSSRWSRPATGKQIAALKAHSTYDGKYYSMGRASQAIGKGSTGGERNSGGGLSSGTAYSSLAASGLGTSQGILRLFGGTEGLDSLLQPALGQSMQSRLASSGGGPTSLLSQLLDVPDNIDSLVQAALSASDRNGPEDDLEDGPVESVLYTIRPDDSGPGEPRIVVEAEVVHDQTFEGHPSLQVRFAGKDEKEGSRSADVAALAGSRSVLGYRPRWTPVLVRTPAELAEQMRVRWKEALGELQEGFDPRMATFLTGAQGMASAFAVLTSGQSPVSKFVLLQGLMDPEGQIQYKGLGLDAPTFAGQIRAASEGDEDALDWLVEVQNEEVLTSFSEVMGNSLGAEADFRLSRWHKQGMDLIEAVTVKSENAGFDFSTIRALLKVNEEYQAKLTKRRESAADNPALLEYVDRDEARFERLSRSDGSLDHGILEDWFFEETRLFLQVRFRRSLPGQFAAALAPISADAPGHGALAAEVRRLAASSSTDPHVYTTTTATVAPRRFGPFGLHSDQSHADRVARIIQAVRRAIADVDNAGHDDLGTLIVAQEVLGYAQWKRDELRAAELIREADSHQSAAAQRTNESQERAEASLRRETDALTYAKAANDLEQIVQKHSNALAQTTRSIDIDDPVPDAALSTARSRVEQAKLREATASARLAAAEEREQWAAEAASTSATPVAKARILAERDLALAEQSDAKAEQNAARKEHSAALNDIRLFTEARARFDELIREVRTENERRVREESERRREQEARQAEQRRQQAEEHRKNQEAERQRQEAATRRQEDLNQRQQDKANAAKKALKLELERLVALPSEAPFWRRKALARSRASLQQAILRLQAEIVGPLAPPRTRAKTWPNMLSRNERYLGTVKKIVDYGVFVSLPTGTDGLLRGSEASGLREAGELVGVEIVDIPYGKPIVLKRIPG